MQSRGIVGRTAQIHPYPGVVSIDTLLLLALPASGKSELRRFLESLGSDRSEYGLGPLVQLDDYPYVHLMRRISEEQRNLGIEPTFFESDTASLSDARDWGTLIHLVNEDYSKLSSGWGPIPDPGRWLLERIGRARSAAGADSHLHSERIVARIQADAAAFAADHTGIRKRPGDTVVIEFARGGPDGSTMPIAEPKGYAFSLGLLSEAILAGASILYVWVTPEESRKRNRERAHIDGDASILHHGVPEEVMLNDYGCDDISWLIDSSPDSGSIRVDGHRIPIARFDNRVDKTSFLRDDNWPPHRVATLSAELLPAFRALQSR